MAKPLSQKGKIKQESNKMDLPKLFLILLVFIYYEVSSAQPYKTLVAPITKDDSTSLYAIVLNLNEKYVIDLTSPFLWYICPAQHPQVSCSSPPCSLAQLYSSASCHSNNSNRKKLCTCLITPVNPITKLCALSPLTYRNFSVFAVNGSNILGSIELDNRFVSCAPESLLHSLPNGVIGLAGLSRAPLSLSYQFNPPSLGATRKFAICLPDTSRSPGLVFFGDGPYNLMPPTTFDVSTILDYTPLLKNPKSPNYYIGVRGISIGGNTTFVSSKLLALDRLGHGGVVLSTVSPYTALTSDIYRSFLKSFKKGTEGIPRVKTVKPFSLCLNATAIGFSRVGLHVPQIDLELANGKNWTIFGANSMKLIGLDTACLAFVDGGKTAEAVIIGSFQMENNLLLFDLPNSRLGFSSSLLFIRTTCSNFNFTGIIV